MGRRLVLCYYHFMSYIRTIFDKDIFPNKETAQVAEWILRKTVKIIIQNNEGKIALVTSPIHNCFLLPGGGIDKGEEIFNAANRESKEEALCSITEPEMFGVTQEYRARDGKRYETYGVFAHIGETITEDSRTDEEKENSLTVVWCTTEEAKNKFSQQEILLRNGKIDFYNIGFNIVRDQILFKTALEKKLL